MTYGKELEKHLFDRIDNELDIGNASRDYTKLSSIIGGLVASGVGYTVSATGFFVKDVLTSLYYELPNLYNQAASGHGYAVPYKLMEIVASSLSGANHMGGIGAAVGMIGGTVFFGRLRNSILSVLRGG